METTSQEPKIGLALSGGGFRASLFHLGVIRRLEELGVMKNVAAISSVSGGSIIAAYYLIEMERRLRERRAEVESGTLTIDQVRQQLCAEITSDFCSALDHNLRTRALVFAPFYHPLHWYKSLSPGQSRSDLIQLEYDRWFYHDVTLSQLPVATPENERANNPLLAGPRLILNTTSLMTGERVGFSRVPISGIDELKTVNKNVLPLARVVGASSCVPGLFPPVSISGDLLVDGGVSDNQGIEGLKEEGCDVMLVSDASGQMEQVHAQSARTVPVVGRVTSILQFQVRNKLLEILQQWATEKEERRFAFIHLFLDLKGRDVPRLPSEFIPGTARIRTDLDQFSLFEREVLMYHGYTLIDAQLRKYCPNILEDPDHVPKPKCPPLFQDQPAAGDDAADSNLLERRERLKTLIETGAENVFLWRSLRRYPRKAGTLLGLNLLLPLALLVFYVGLEVKRHQWLTDHIGKPLLNWLDGLVPGWLRWLFTHYFDFLHWPITAEGVTVLILLALFFYLLAFSTYVIMRRTVRRLDLQQYRQLTDDQMPSAEW